MFITFEVDSKLFTFVSIKLHQLAFGPTFNCVNSNLGVALLITRNDFSDGCIVNVLPRESIRNSKVVKSLAKTARGLAWYLEAHLQGQIPTQRSSPKIV